MIGRGWRWRRGGNDSEMRGGDDSATREATEWHTRLASRFVSNEDLADFAQWRKRPANAEAYSIVEAAQEDGAARKSNTWRVRLTLRRLAGVIMVALFACVAAGTLWWTAPTTYRTGTGEQLLVRLEDGSQVRLDTASTIRVRLRARRRAVELVEGQAYFHVAHDTQRPFAVRAGQVVVRDVGTAFVVHRSADGVAVGLIEGLVDVTGTDDAGPFGLSAGRMLEIDPQGQTRQSVLGPEATAWIYNRIVFHDTPLRRAIAEVNRYLPHPISLLDEAKAKQRISGTFVTGDGDAFVAAITAILPLQAERKTDGTIVLQ